MERIAQSVIQAVLAIVKTNKTSSSAQSKSMKTEVKTRETRPRAKVAL